MAGKGPLPLGFLIETENETDFPPSLEVIERDDPEKLAVTVEGFLGKSPSSWFCKAALTSLFLQAKSSLVTTDLPSKNLKGFGSLELAVLGKVDGTAHAASWRCSSRGVARTALERSERAIKYFILNFEGAQDSFVLNAGLFESLYLLYIDYSLHKHSTSPQEVDDLK